jgi:hypothetical protein
MGKHLLSEHLKLIADSVTYCGEVMGATFPGFKALCTSTSISTPFTKAAFQVCDSSMRIGLILALLLPCDNLVSMNLVCRHLRTKESFCEYFMKLSGLLD